MAYSCFCTAQTIELASSAGQEGNVFDANAVKLELVAKAAVCLRFDSRL